MNMRILASLPHTVSRKTLNFLDVFFFEPGSVGPKTTTDCNAQSFFLLRTPVPKKTVCNSISLTVFNLRFLGEGLICHSYRCPT